MVPNVSEKYLKMKIHILGICGTFMGGLAQILIEKGYQVSGTDHQFYSPMSDQLKDLGITLIEGYQPSMLPSADLYVIGNALSRGNESVEHILNQQLPYTSGPQLLGEILKDRTVIAVSGTHGKTSTSFMLAEILESQGIDFGYLVGGVSHSFASSARLGSNPLFVIEADEYDSAFFDKRSKFIHYHPRTFLINNIEFDHADIFLNLSEILKQFHHAVRLVPNHGNVLIHSNEKNASDLIAMGCWSNLYTVGDSHGIELDLPGNCFTHGDQSYALSTLPFYGDYNYKNAMMAMFAASLHGVSIAQSFAALQSFHGVKRRFETIYSSEQYKVIDDFAHHPTAIASTIKAATELFDNKKIIGVIELGSNTMSSGFHGDALFESAGALDHVLWLNLSNDSPDANEFNALEPLLHELKNILDENSVILIMSNKDSKKISEPIINYIENK